MVFVRISPNSEMCSFLEVTLPVSEACKFTRDREIVRNLHDTIFLFLSGVILAATRPGTLLTGELSLFFLLSVLILR